LKGAFGNLIRSKSLEKNTLANTHRNLEGESSKKSKPVSSSEKLTSQKLQTLDEKSRVLEGDNPDLATPQQAISELPNIDETTEVVMTGFTGGQAVQKNNIFKDYSNKSSFVSLRKDVLDKKVNGERSVGGVTYNTYPYSKVVKGKATNHRIINILMDKPAFDAYVKYYDFKVDITKNEVSNSYQSLPPKQYKSKREDPKSLVDDKEKPKKEYHFLNQKKELKNLADIFTEANEDVKVDFVISKGKVTKTPSKLSEKITVNNKKTKVKLFYTASISGWKIEVKKEKDFTGKGVSNSEKKILSSKEFIKFVQDEKINFSGSFMWTASLLERTAGALEEEYGFTKSN